jgi:hypothetical protein
MVILAIGDAKEYNDGINAIEYAKQWCIDNGYTNKDVKIVRRDGMVLVVKNGG